MRQNENGLILPHKTFFWPHVFLDSVHKYFLNQILFDIKKGKWIFLACITSLQICKIEAAMEKAGVIIVLIDTH